MKAARIVVLVVAIGAGGVAALLMAGRSDLPVEVPAPVAQIDTVDVLVAKNDLGIGQPLGQQDIAWQAWPSASAQTDTMPGVSSQPHSHSSWMRVTGGSHASTARRDVCTFANWARFGPNQGHRAPALPPRTSRHALLPRAAAGMRRRRL